MSRVHKALLGCLAVTVLAVLGGAVLAALNWDEIGRAIAEGERSEEDILGEELENRFGDRPTVEFVCRLPMVDVAPCFLVGEGEGKGTREVVLTFSSYEPPAGVAHEDAAREIARAASTLSTFAGQADTTEVVFVGDSASADGTLTFSFSSDE